MNKYSLIVLAISLFISLTPTIEILAQKLPAPFVILPQPQSVILQKGSGLESGILQQILLQGEFNRPVMGEILSKLTIGKSKGKGTLELILDTTLTTFRLKKDIF